MLVELRNALEYAKRKNIFDRVKKLEIELVKINYVNNPSKLQSELELNKIRVVDRNLLVFEQELLRGYAGEFQTIGKLSIGDEIRETH